MLTYAVEHVGVQHVVLVGHTNCGGAAACAKLAQEPPTTSSPSSAESESPLLRWLGPLTDIARALPPGADLTALAEENVRAGVRNLAASAVVKGAWAAGRPVEVHGWLYELETGRLRDLGVSVGKDGAL